MPVFELTKASFSSTLPGSGDWAASVSKNVRENQWE
jgi:hypothetical protein